MGRLTVGRRGTDRGLTRVGPETDMRILVKVGSGHLGRSSGAASKSPILPSGLRTETPARRIEEALQRDQRCGNRRFSTPYPRPSKGRTRANSKAGAKI